MELKVLNEKISALLSEYNSYLPADSDDRIGVAQLLPTRPKSRVCEGQPASYYVTVKEFSTQSVKSASVPPIHYSYAPVVGWDCCDTKKYGFFDGSSGRPLVCIPVSFICDNFQGNRCG